MQIVSTEQRGQIGIARAHTHTRIQPQGLILKRLAVATLLAFGLGTVAPPSRAADDGLQQAIKGANSFLETSQRGRDILSVVHYGANTRATNF